MLQIHYIRVSVARSGLFLARTAIFLVLGLALAALVACSGGDDPPPDNGKSSGGGNSSISSSSGGNPSPSSPSGSSSSGGGTSSGGDGVSSSGGGNSNGGGVSNPNLDDDLKLKLDSAIVIKYNNGTVEYKNNYSDKVAIDIRGEDVVVTLSDSTLRFILTGTTSNGSLKIYGDFKKSLYLNNVSITNKKGPAINIQNHGKTVKASKRVNVHLVDGTTNFLSDAAGYKCKDFAEGEEQAKGAFFSEGKLEFKEGKGSLEVKGKCNHAIVADNNIEIEEGKITVSEAEGDGIHANDKIQVRGGEITIRSKGDGIQSEKEAVAASEEWNVFSGGKIDIQTTGINSHGIVSEGPITIADSASTNITIKVSGNGSKGIKSKHWLEILGGKISIETSGGIDKTDPTDESSPSGIKLVESPDTFFKIENGELTIKTAKEGAKGINVAGNVYIKGGKINIDAYDDGLKVHGTLQITGGTGSIKSKSQKAIDVDGTFNGDTGSITTKNGVS